MALPKRDKPWRLHEHQRQARKSGDREGDRGVAGAFGHAPVPRQARLEAERKRAAHKGWWWNLLAVAECAYCLRWTEPKERTRDHVVAVSLGGKTEPWNMVMACSACNAAKNKLGFWGCLWVRCREADRAEVVRRICEQTGLSEAELKLLRR